jgi:hypothetical protein
MPEHCFRLFALFAFAAVVPAFPQAPRPTVHTVAVVRRQPGAATGAASAADDRRVEAAIRARFAQSKIGANKFEVHVQGGVATIQGHADIAQHKGTATRLAKSAGALAVVNRIELSEAARQKSAANLAKGRRRVQIKRGEPRSQTASR